jgi:nitrate reductase alpha subunit
MIILGAGVNHWYHMDMNYRGMINMLVFCGCVGQSGGGWSHYVGQEKLRPPAGCRWPSRWTGTVRRVR